MIKVLKARREHLPVIVPLFDAYRRFYRQPPYKKHARAFLRQRLRDDDSVILLAMVKSRPLGFVQLYPSFDSVAMQRIWILYDLFVVPEARGSGVAQALMKRARRLAAETKAGSLILETAKTNRAAQRLYEKLGWKRERKFYRYCLNV